MQKYLYFCQVPYLLISKDHSFLLTVYQVIFKVRRYHLITFIIHLLVLPIPFILVLNHLKSFSNQTLSTLQSSIAPYSFRLPFTNLNQLLLLSFKNLSSLFLYNLKVLLIFKFHPDPLPFLPSSSQLHTEYYQYLFLFNNFDQTSRQLLSKQH